MDLGERGESFHIPLVDLGESFHVPFMDPGESFVPPDLFPASSLTSGIISLDEQSETKPTKAQLSGTSSFVSIHDETGTSDGVNMLEDSTQRYNPTVGPAAVVDPAENVKGMYRLLDLISESGSSGYVDKVVIAQNSLERFINDISPGAYASITRVDFKTLDLLAIKPLGVYGSKDEIVRLLRLIGAIDENEARSLLNPTDIDGPQSGLSSGLYIVRANTTKDLPDERHYVIYWPEDSTWDDSAPSSVRRNRITFMRYLTKMCDQVIVLLSREYSSSIVWGNGDIDTESIDMYTGNTDRRFTFEVSKRNEQEEGAVARPGFQMRFRHIPRNKTPPDCPVDPAILVPRLLPGETVQGFLTAAYKSRHVHTDPFNHQSFTRLSLQQLLMDNALVLSETLDENAMQTLLDLSIADRFPEQCNEWHAAKQDISDFYSRESTKRERIFFEELASKGYEMRPVLRDVVVEDVMGIFPSLERDSLSSSHSQLHEDASEVTNSMLLSNLNASYPDFQEIYRSHFQCVNFDTVLMCDRDFEARKIILVSARHLLEKHQRLHPEKRAQLAESLLEGDFNTAQCIARETKTGLTMIPSWIRRPFNAISGLPSPSDGESLIREMKSLAARNSDSQFLLEMKGVHDEVLRPMIQEIEALSHSLLSSLINTTVDTMARAVMAMQREVFKRTLRCEIENKEMKLQNEALKEFIQKLNARSTERNNQCVYIDGVSTTPSGRSGDSRGWNGRSPYHSQEYWVTGRREALKNHELEFRVHLMDLSSDDIKSMQSDAKYIPGPLVNDRISCCFHMPTTMNIAFCQILKDEKLLLVLVDRERVFIYLELLPAIDAAIQRGRPIKCLNREKLGQDILFVYDEMKRTLAVCASKRLQLRVFVFDETFKTLQAQGSATDLASWYSQAGTSILRIAFVSGKEEVVLVDSSSRARIFSFITLQIRPASLSFPSLPNAIFSSPDGSCFLVVHDQDSKPSLTAYHWETFGSTAGIPLDVPEFSLRDAVLTSMVSRGCIFLISLDVDTGLVRSIAIDITKKVTEFVFKKKDRQNAPIKREHRTLHNSLLDCHTEVWTRFPVVPAVRRRTVTSLSERHQKSLTFITEYYERPFDSYFSDLVQTFERTVKKPTGEELRRIKVSAAQFETFQDIVALRSEWNVSRYRAGEWLVDLLCLIPIHIAVCRENRFIPLADGVLSSDLERTLLGAEVNQIVDKLSFGWYESIFQSYLATK
jgi:hypothetical protein